ncbi:MAG TPA: hypothetical protein VMV22_08825 [Acidimicrobiales bacterium]|nr:hypothetical protein [Acidimicrobiales bacterium]
MGTVVVIGEAVRTDGFALAGAVVVHAEDRRSVATALTTLSAEVAVVVLTPAAAALGSGVPTAAGVLTVVMPP